MRRIAFALITAVTTVVMGASAALAQSPHFQFANNSIDTSTGALNTMFKEVGLGTGVDSVAITLGADATATLHEVDIITAPWTIDKNFFYVKTSFRHERRRVPGPDRAG